MTRLEALRALHETVKAGDATAKHYRACWPGYMGSDTPYALNAARAADGSLDAALALMKAVLPGWDYPIDNLQRIKPLAFVTDDGGPEFVGEAADPARALLLAILAALIAQAEAQDGPTSTEGEMG